MGSGAVVRASDIGQIKGDISYKIRFPGPPGWGLGHEANNVTSVK